MKPTLNVMRAAALHSTDIRKGTGLK